MAYALRVTDQETARVVSVLGAENRILGSGCLLDAHHVMTCSHVVARGAATGNVNVRLVGVIGQPIVKTDVTEDWGKDDKAYSSDLCLLRIRSEEQLAITPIQFAAPLRHGGKVFSVFGFPGGDPQGRNVRGSLSAADALGLVQMDSNSNLLVEGGFSGAPVWCEDLGAFVGLVVAEQSGKKVAWCIPSRVLCLHYNDLAVRFRIPKVDRPVINDYLLDDPNIELFGTISDNGSRKLICKVRRSKKSGGFVAECSYKVIGGEPARGGCVTFITHPSFDSSTSRGEDAYELFAQLEGNGASVEFYPGGSFTVAAVGDGGDTALAFDLEKVWPD
ncbi:serine protease [Dongia sp.]|uniref:S1 family peptidase n=1 Tax=Dongia sp. TaxID=1977262 RepID=UPI003752BDDB